MGSSTEASASNSAAAPTNAVALSGMQAKLVKSNGDKDARVNHIQPHANVVHALFDFDASDPTDLSFVKGDIIHVTAFESRNHDGQVHEGWWEGECKGKQGMFPANYVEKLDFSGSLEIGGHHVVVDVAP